MRFLFRSALALAGVIVLQGAARAYDSSAAAQGTGFDFYVMSLSWSPSYCAEEGLDANRRQCGINRDFAFIAHGLWPQFVSGYPEYCTTSEPNRVPNALVDKIADIMPSAGLVGHQWRKHGSCTGLSQTAYLEATREAFERIAIPSAFTNALEPARTSAGEVEAAFINANGATPTITSLVDPAIGNLQGDVLAGFSFRGPTPGTAGGLQDTTKPDITAPGVNIWAAWTPLDGGADYKIESGTSMSSPHTAGAAALVRAAQPTWTPIEVKSALMLTAVTNGTKEDGVTPWNVDDVGSGRVDLTRAARAGFVMNETVANFLAANPSGGSINLKTLNLPAVRNVGLSAGTPSYVWTRVLRNAHQGPTTWNVSVDQPAGVNVVVNPTTFSFTGAGIHASDTIFNGDFDNPVTPETQTITITATTTASTGGIVFGQVNFTEAGSLAPPAHITMAVRRQ